MLQGVKLALPLGGVDAVRELAAGEVELPELAFVLDLELFTLGLPLDGVQLVVDGLRALVLVGVSQQVAQLFHAAVLGVEVGFYAS